MGPAPSMEMLGDGCDGLVGLVGGVAGLVDWCWRVEELAAQVVQEAEPGVGGVHAAPAA